MTSVLVLDDQATGRELLSTVLGYAGYRVLEASTGYEALELARRDRPDLVIVDVLMPKMDGYEFVRRLRSDGSAGEVPVMFCTANYSVDEVRQLADACGVTSILVKPCAPEEIIRMVGEALGSPRELAPLVPSKEFQIEHPRVLNDMLLQKVKELEAVNLEQERLHEVRSVIMENIAEGLYVLDGEGRLMFMNAAASRMLGWGEEELHGKEMDLAIHSHRADGSPLPENGSDLSKVLVEGQTVRAEDAFIRKDGSIFPIAYSAAPLLSGTTVRGVVVVFRDIFEEQAERTRVQRELDSLTWVGRTRDALEEGRLVLHSQPIFSITGREQHSEELLLRMVGRDGEIIPPGRFLPAAEKFGLIGDIDRWVVTQAISMAAAGRRLAANLSADSIGNVDLLSVIEHELRETGADPSNIVFEITETALMRDVDAGVAFAEGVVQLGCEVALDDFGTGFGSFTYLKRLPIKYLKIDIEFVRHLTSNPANQHIVKAIVNLAQGFGQQTIAEGVEDEETLELLRECGVDLAQGFHLGRPAPIEVLAAVHELASASS